MEAAIHVYTFKEGLLSKLAHDLKLSLTRFEISARGGEVHARLDPASLRVIGVMRAARLDAVELSAADKDKINENIVREVLHTREHGDIRFKGRASVREAGFAVEGTLQLRGETRPLTLQLDARNERLVGEVELVPSQWGVKPFRALGGTLRVQDRVRVTIDASADWLVDALNPSVELVWRPRP